MSQSIKLENPALIGVAVIGSGYWGRNLVRNYYELGVLKLICDKNEMALAEFRSRYPDIDTSIALSEVLRREEVECVVLATPAETHFELARESLLAGKHVYVEKPLVLHEQQAEELISLADELGLTLMVGHLLRYHPAFRTLANLAVAGELGRINYIYSHRLNLGKIRREENILWSFAPHDISMILALAGEEPESVLATGGNYLHQRIADVTTTHLDFASGLKAHIFVSWLHPFKVQQLVVVGERKMAVFDDTRPWPEKLLLYPHEINWQDHMPVPTKADAERVEIVDSGKEPLRLECEHFLECVCRRQPPLTDGREALRVLRVLNAGQQSLDRNGEKVVFSHDSRGVSDSKEACGAYFVHPTAVIDDQVDIGDGTRIWHFSHILAKTRIGRDCTIGQNVMIGPRVTVGDCCKIQNNVSVYRGVTLEEGVFCGPSMVFTNVYDPRAEISKMDEIRPTLVKRGATIGANATIVCGVTLGRYCFIGAGAVVTRDVPDHALVVGNPARHLGWVCYCGKRLRADGDKMKCGSCGRRYREDGEEKLLHGE